MCAIVIACGSDLSKKNQNSCGLAFFCELIVDLVASKKLIEIIQSHSFITLEKAKKLLN